MKITTRTSETGSNRSPLNGFTLLEVVVVLAIMGIAIGTVLYAMGDSHKLHMLRREAERLEEVLQLASDDAILRGREWGLVITHDGYRMAYFNRQTKSWIQAPEKLLADYTLPDMISLQITGMNHLVLPDDPFSQNEEHPALLLLSSGQKSAFTMKMRIIGDDVQAEIFTTDGYSDITLYEDFNDKK